jgi:hypothetical protein
VPIVLKPGSLNLLESSGPVKACNEIALPLLLPQKYIYKFQNGEMAVVSCALQCCLISTKVTSLWDHPVNKSCTFCKANWHFSYCKMQFRIIKFLLDRHPSQCLLRSVPSTYQPRGPNAFHSQIVKETSMLRPPKEIPWFVR